MAQQLRVFWHLSSSVFSSAGFHGHLYTYDIYSYRHTFIMHNKIKSLQKSLLMWGNIEGLNEFG